MRTYRIRYNFTDFLENKEYYDFNGSYTNYKNYVRFDDAIDADSVKFDGQNYIFYSGVNPFYWINAAVATVSTENGTIPNLYYDPQITYFPTTTGDQTYIINEIFPDNTVFNKSGFKEGVNYTGQDRFFYRSTKIIATDLRVCGDSMIFYSGNTAIKILSAKQVFIDNTSSFYNITLEGTVRNYYATYTSTETQNILDGTSYTVVSYNNVEIENGVSLVDNTKVKVKYPGVYEIGISPMIETTSNNDTDIDIWFRLNGTNIVRSNSITSSKFASQKGLPYVQLILELKRDDYIEILLHSNNNSTGARIAYVPGQTGPARPESPSIILDIKNVGVAAAAYLPKEPESNYFTGPIQIDQHGTGPTSYNPVGGANLVNRIYSKNLDGNVMGSPDIWMKINIDTGSGPNTYYFPGYLL